MLHAKNVYIESAGSPHFLAFNLQVTLVLNFGIWPKEQAIEVPPLYSTNPKTVIVIADF